MSPTKFSTRLTLVLTVAAAIIFAAPVASATSKEFALHAFRAADGQSTSGLIPDASGNLYGEDSGGAHGAGAIFKLTHTSNGWKESVVYSFPGGKGGRGPVGGLVWDANGNLYGTTAVGGNVSFCNGTGCGTVFELSPTSGGKWKETVLYRFGNCSLDGCLPYGGVIFDKSRRLYGITVGGGGPHGIGTVFKLTPTSSRWKEGILHSFMGGKDGANPTTGLVFDTIGNLYGATTHEGGCDGCGTIFELSPTSGGGWQEKTIHIFSGGNDGRSPNGPLILDAAGNLYGTTFYGGTTNSFGVAFELTLGSDGTWTDTVLQNFTVQTGNEAAGPMAGLVFDSTGNLYGTTYYGGGINNCGGRGCGTVFELAPSGGQWTESVLYSFTGGTDGQNPMVPLIVDSAGKLYGTTFFGGTHNLGVVFQVNP